MSRRARLLAGGSLLLLILSASLLVERRCAAPLAVDSSPIRSEAVAAPMPLSDTWATFANHAPLVPLFPEELRLTPFPLDLPRERRPASTEPPPRIAFLGGRNADAGTAESRTASVPEELTPPADAAPIREHVPRSETPRPGIADETIRRIIEDALPDVTPDEQDAWLDSLRGMKSAEIRDLLEMRRVFGSNTPGGLAPMPSAPLKTPESAGSPAAADRPENHAHDGWSRSGANPHSEELNAAQELIEMARTVVLNNIANANTAGFKRSEVVFGGSPYIGLDQQSEDGTAATRIGSLPVSIGLQISRTRTDMSQGDVERTGRPLDLSLRGAGFFAVRYNAETLLTRAGRAAVNSEGWLCLDLDGALHPLEPGIRISTDAVRVSISPKGIVEVLQPGEEVPTRAGEIKTVTVLSPESLIPVDGCLFSLVEAAGPPRIANPGTRGHGAIRSGGLEDSNVSLERELAMLEKLQKQWNALESAAAILNNAPPRRPAPESQTSPEPPPRVAERILEQPTASAGTSGEPTGPAFPDQSSRLETPADEGVRSRPATELPAREN